MEFNFYERLLNIYPLAFDHASKMVTSPMSVVLDKPYLRKALLWTTAAACACGAGSFVLLSSVLAGVVPAASISVLSLVVVPLAVSCVGLYKKLGVFSDS